MTVPTPIPERLTMAAFAAAVTLGGGNFVAVRFSNLELPPIWGAGLRFSLAAGIFLAMAAALRLSWPRGRQFLLTAVYGLFSFTLSYALVYWALVRLTAGMVAVVLAIVPLVTPLLAGAQRMERIERRTLAGAGIALVGITIMTVGPAALAIPASGVVAVLVASLTIAQSVILGKKVAGNHPVMTNAVGMSVGSAGLLAVSMFAGETWALPTRPEVVSAVIYLVVLGSVGMFVLLLLVMRRWTASASAYAFVLFPVITMVIEALLAGEPLTLTGVTGAFTVMGGVWLGALRRPRARAATAAVRTTREQHV